MMNLNPTVGLTDAMSKRRINTARLTPQPDFFNHGWTRINSDKKIRIRVHLCPSVVKKFARPGETFTHGGTNEHESAATGRPHPPGYSDSSRICFILRVHSCPFVVTLSFPE